MAGSTALIVAMQAVAIMATISGAFAQEGFGPSPAPAPQGGAGCALQLSTASVASAVVVSMWAILKN